MTESHDGRPFKLRRREFLSSAALPVAAASAASAEEKIQFSVDASFLTGGTVTAMKQVLRTKGLELPRDYNTLDVAKACWANLVPLASGQLKVRRIEVSRTAWEHK